MKKPTTLKTLIFVLALLFNFASHAQNWVAFDSKLNSISNANLFLKANNQNENPFSLDADKEVLNNAAPAPLTNPVIPYAQLPYAGQVAQCPNDGKLLPKLFLCGGNDSRAINTGITDAQSIIWERFISGGSCITVSNSDCANEAASASCWVKVAEGKDYLANSAGQFRIRIVDNTGTPHIFYFNVYQNTLIPTAITKSDIIRNSAGTCQITGNITVGGFGSGYEYSFTTTGSSGTFQDSNIFNTTTPGNYTAYIRIKGVVGSCEFKVINQDIKNVTYAVTTEIVAPRCYDGKGSIRVITNDIKKKYTYNIYKPTGSTNPLSSFGPTENAEYTFTGLDSGTYRVETVVQGSNCMIDDKTRVVVPNAPNQLTSTPTITKTLNSCSSGEITVATGGGTYPFRYLVSINGAPSFQNANNIITTVASGKYLIRVEDANGCYIEKEINVPTADKPTYTITKTDGDCANPNGKITINVTETKGYTIETRLQGENNYTSSAYNSMTLTGTTGSRVYSNVPPENYIISVRYTKNWTTCTEPNYPISIGLTTALTASAGVAELSGCGPVGNVQKGKVRITNAEGGVPITGPTGPYQYSYDGKNTWTTDKEAYVNPGTHIFYVKDANCEIALPAVTLLEQPAAPTIRVAAPVFNCDGSATTTVTVTNSGSGSPQFTYDYFIDGVLNTNTPTNVFRNVTQGDHTISVSYNVVSVPTESILLNETFGSGPDVSSPGINPNFCWERQVEATKCNNDKLFGNGEYTVTNLLRNNPYSGWWSPKDNTSGGTNSNGRFLAVDAGSAIPNNAVLYRKTIKDIIPNVPIKVTFVGTNLLKVGNNQPDASLTVELQNASGVALSSQSTGGIPKTNGWVPYTRTINPGNNTTLDFVLRLELSQVNGIDFAVDDLVVTQMPKACNTVANFPIVVDGSKAFSAGITGYKDVKCIGERNGEITLSAKNFDPVKGFQYSVDGGNWETVIPVPASNIGSKTLTGLAGKIYNIRIRYDDAAGSCVFPLAQEIKIPKALKVNAWVDQVATCTTGATIKAEASDGTPGYEYELRETDGVTVVKAFQSTGEFFDIKKTGNYKVIARDSNLCETAVLASVDVVASTPPNIGFDTSNLCFGTTAQIIVRVNGGVADYTYTTQFNGGTVSDASATFTGPTFTYVATEAGTYTFVVKDSFGCESNSITQIINEKLTVEVPVTKSLTCDVAPNNRAIITGTISGGKEPFVVAVASGNTSGNLVQPTITGNTFTYTTAVAGDYTFRITDSGNCTVVSKTATITPLNAIVLTSDNVNPKCNSSNDGTILLKPSGGAGGFTYSTDGITYNDKSYFTGLSAGVEYTYYVKDSNKCTETIKVTLLAPDNINGTASITTPYTCDSPAVITVGTVVSGGNGIYKYTLNRNGVALTTQDTKVFSGITAAGNYTVTITDGNSCTFTTTPALTINALDSPKGMTISTTTAATCPTNKGSVTITNVVNASNVAVSTTGLEYRIVSPTATAFQPSNVFNNLDANVTYKFEVRDANKCLYDKTHLIALPKAFTVAGIPTSIKCFGASDGSAEFTVTGIDAGTNYSYVVDTQTPQTGTSAGSPFTITVPNLNAGLHKISVTSSLTKCTISENVTIAGPASALQLNPSDLTHVTCKVLGTAKINAVGGTGTYTYTVTQKTPVVGTAVVQNNNNLFKNLVAGTYSVSVADGSGCSVTGTDFTINDSVDPSATISATSSYCAGGAGATLIATPSVAPQPNPNYEYRINGGAYQSSGTFPGLIPGKYTITVRDIVTGCTADLAEETILAPLSAKLDPLVKNLDCDATNPNAIIKVVISNGYPDYTYRVNTNGGGFSGTPIPVLTGSNTFNYTTTTGSAAATYEFEIFDSKGCRTTVTQNISARVSPTAVTTPINPTCYNGTNGSIEVTASLGLSPYTYEVSTTSATTGFSPMATNKHNNIGAGTYWFRVTDANKCTFVVSETLNNPAQLTAHADVTTPLKCGAGNAPQAATITVTIDNPGTPYAGTNKYRYSYNGGTPVTSNTYTTTATGTVTVDVYDANNCPFRVLISPEVEALDPPKNMTFDTPAAITCATGKDKTDLTVKVDDGVAPFTFEITDTDAAVAPTNPVTTNVLTQDHIFRDLAPGKYYFKVTDKNGCTTLGEYTIDKVLPVVVNGSVVSNVNCKGTSDGELTFTVSGNSGTFTYELRNASNALIPILQSSQSGNIIVYTGLPANVYTITITNPTTECTATKTLEVKEANVQFAFNAPTITPITCSPNNGKVVINTVGGWGNNRYTLTLPNNTVVGPQASSTFNNLTQSGTYGISVTDLNGNGCPITTTFNVDAAIQPDASIDLIASDLCYDEVGKAEIVVTPAVTSPSYMYNINDGTYQASGTFSNLNPGSYVVKVKDMTTGCILTLPAQAIETELKFNAKLETLANCNGQDIEIKGTISGGKTPYTYTVTINGTLDSTARTVTGTTFTYTDPTATSASGDTTYLFTLSDASTTHCSLTSTVVVAPKTDPAFSLTPNSTILCNGDATGSITVTIVQTTGASPYTINVTKDNSALGIPDFNYGTQTTGLPAGDYTVRVTDAKGCFHDETTIIIDTPKITFSAPFTQITCDQTGTSGTSFGSISVAGLSGGTPGYIYTLTSNTSSTQTFTPVSNENHTFTVLNFGIYELTVSDANGCSVTKTISLSSPPEDLKIDVTAGAASCTTASVVVSVNPSFTGGPYHFARYPIISGFTPPYSYPLNPSGTYQDADSSIPADPLYLQSTFTGLNPGVVYSFIVYDETTKCYYFKQAEAPTLTSSSLTSDITAANVTCTGAGDGKVSFTFANLQTGTTQVKYEIFNSQTNTLVTPLVGGTVALPTTSVSNVGPLLPGTYYILFTEQDGLGNTVCLNSSKMFTITQSVVPLTLKTTSKNDNCGPAKGVIEAFGQGGTVRVADVANGITAHPYLYQVFPDTGTAGVIDNVDPVPTDAAFSATFSLTAHTSNTFNRDNGHYIVYVKDANGCIAPAFVEVKLDPSPVIRAVTNNICVTEGSFVIDVNLDVTGVGQHYYILDGGAPIPLPSASFSITNLSSGAHSVEVTDLNGCGNKVDLDLISTPLTIKASFTPDPKCEDTDGVITAVVTGGFSPNNFEYTLAKTSTPPITNIVQNNPVFNGIGAGDYTITVRDINTGCSRSTDVKLILPTLIDFVLSDITTTPVDCTSGQGTVNNGTLTVNLSTANDNPDYTYVLTPISPAGTAITQKNNNVFTGLSAGDYEIKVISARGCEKTLPANVPAPPAVVASADATPFSCAIDPTVTTVVVTGLGGSGTYTFSKDNVNFFTSNSTPPDNKYTFEIDDILTTQNPTYWVKDSNGCLDSSTLTTPLEPLPKLISATATRSTAAGSQIDCVNGREVIQIDVVGGSTTPTDLRYEVSIDGATYIQLTASSLSRTYNYDATTAGSKYQFRITDNATGCDILTNIYDVPLFDAINVTATTVADVTCKSATNGNIEIFVSGYTGPYTYALYNGATAVVGAGASGSHDTATSNPFTIPFGLGEGSNYTVRIVELNYPRCTTTSTVAIINEPTVALVLDPLDVTPLGCTTDGAVKVTAQGGWGNNKFTLTPPSGSVITNTDGIFGGLRLDGLYGVSVQDANGCTITDSFTLVIPTPPTAVIASTSDYCYDNTNLATLVVTPSGGAGGYEFSIDNGKTWTNNNTFDKLTPGIYDIIVKDAYGCEVTVSNNEIKPQLVASSVNQKDIFCNGTVDGTIKISAAGGYGSYSYTVNKDNAGASLPIAFPVGSDTAEYTVTGNGTYEFVVYDARNCSYVITDAISMLPPTPVDLLQSDIAITPVDCNGAQGTNNNGTITVNLRAVNDNPDYTYTLTPTMPAGPAVVQLNNNLFTGLTPGQYNVSVTSGRECEANVNVTIADPVVVTASATATPFSCAVDPTKTTAVVTAGGGTGTYTFSRDGISYSGSNSVPADNKYTFDLVDTQAVQDPTFYVKDSNGCIQTTKLNTVLNPLPQLVSATATRATAPGSQMDCLNLREQIQIDVVGGSTPSNFTYEVSIDGNTYTVLTTSFGTPYTYLALTAGSNYQFRITDNVTGCSILSNVYDVPLFDNAKVNAVASANVDCNGNATGAIEINVTDYTGPYNYQVFIGTNPVAVTAGPGDTTTNPYVIPFGFTAGTNYRVVVTETAYPSCIVTSNDVTITEPAALSLVGFKVDVKNQYCDKAAAVITIDPTTIVGGTGGYKYAVVPTTTPPTVPAIGDYNTFTTIEIATAKISPAFDSYDVYVKDDNGCFSFVTVNIAQDPEPVITSVVPTHCPSTTGYEITVTASGFTSDLEYSIDKNTWKLNDNVLVVTSPGDYTVYVRDANLCIVEAPVTILKPLQLRYELTTPPICNGNEGEVTLFASGGTVSPSYEYSKDGGAFVSSNIFSGLVPGTYIFTVRDTGTNCTKDLEVVITIPNTAIDFSLVPSPAICNAGSTGTITVKMAATAGTVNNNPEYTYAINPAPIGMVLAGNVFTNLPQGTYTVTVTSGKGCTVDQTTTVTEPQPIVVPNPVVAEYLCTTGNKENNATITVPLPSGGSNKYTVYEFFRNGNPVAVQRGDNPVYIESDLLGGNYVINVYDDKGCLGTNTATIQPFVGIEFATPAAITVTTAITCINDENIQVNAITVGTATPMPVLSYNVKGISAGSTYDQTNNGGAFTGLTIGNYLVTVTNPITGCFITTIHYVNNPNTFELERSTKNVICYGSATGSVDLTIVDNEIDPTNDAGAFDYVITGPVNLSGTTSGATINIPNLIAGVYTVTAKLVGPPSCEIERSFIIEQSDAALTISESHTPITCDPGNDGTITVSAQGGWLGGDYLYELVGPVNVGYSTQSYFENLTAGVYTVNVKDVNGCIDTATVTLKNPDPILFTAIATVNTLLCNGDTSGEITVGLPTGGQEMNYSYILNYLSTDPVMSTESQTSPVFSGLSAGRYSVTVVDGLNCVSAPSAEIVISEPSKVEPSLTLATKITCKTDTTLTLSAIGGSGPYQYSTDQTFTTIAGSFGSSTTFSVGIGDHQYYVRDSNGCIGVISNNVTINPLTPLSLELDLMNAKVYCKGSATAVIDAVGVGGLGNYSYTLFNNSGVVVRGPQPEGYFDLLPKGVYVVRVDSGDCQYDSDPITINEPDAELLATPTVTNATCFGANNGKIVIAATGGTGVVKYAISPNLGQFDDKFTFDRLSPGKYTIIVQDENSCFVIIEREITEPNPLEGKVVGPIIQEICDGDRDGSFTIEVSGGTLPYSVSLDNENGTYVLLNNGTRHDFSNLKGGLHNVYIKDASCTTMVEVNMDNAVILNPTAAVTYDCVNNSQSNMVVVTIDPSNNPTDVDYSLDNSGIYQPSNIFTNVPAGNHFIVARHTNGCEVPTTVFPVNAVAELGLIDVTKQTTEVNTITVKASGGVAPYEYSFNGESFSSSNTYRIYKSGIYKVIVRDKNGCEATIDVEGTFYDFCMPNYFTPNGDGQNDAIGPDCGALAYKELTFDVYDRYGRVVGKYHVGGKWDGRYQGNELPTGDYWYVLKLNDPKDPREFVGHFTLYR